MKLDWDRLAEAFDGDEERLIADIDCTAEGAELCEEFGIEGFPTIMYGDVSDLQDYQGGRDFESLKAFADANLKPMCSPKNLDLCDADKKAEIEKLMKLDVDTLSSSINEKEESIEKLEEELQVFLEGLQKQYEDKMEEVETKKQAIKDSGLGLMKAVRSFLAKQAGNDEL